MYSERKDVSISVELAFVDHDSVTKRKARKVERELSQSLQAAFSDNRHVLSYIESNNTSVFADIDATINIPAFDSYGAIRRYENFLQVYALLVGATYDLHVTTIDVYDGLITLFYETSKYRPIPKLK